MPGDLHIHTTFSDGFLAPAQVVEVAKKVGLTTISITDHDAVGGVGPAIEAGRTCGITVIPGIEINTKMDDAEIHILGYYIDHNDHQFHQAINESRSTRTLRAQKIVEKLNALNIDIEFEEVERLAGHSTIGRPHISRVLCEHGYTDSVQEAFNRYLKIGAPAYVDLVKWSPFDAITIIKDAGGIPVLAHPGCHKIDDRIPALVKQGLMGIEVYCLKHSSSQIKHYEEIAKEKGLLMTGGSDFHNALDAMYDTVLGSIPLADEHVQALKDRAALLSHTQAPLTGKHQ